MLSAYALACGYIERVGDLSLHRSHGVYHVRGYTASGVYAWEVYTRLDLARRAMRRLAAC